jgi:hypothetical protein
MWRFACLMCVVVAACGSKAGASAADAGSSQVDVGKLIDAAGDSGADALADTGVDAPAPDAGTDALADSADAAAPDAGTDVAADSGADVQAGDAADAGPVVLCTGTTPTFPTFDKSCKTSTECAIASHQINCCGTHVATGIAAGEKAAFDQAELTCESQFPDCDCAQFPTTADDGKSELDGTIVVKCVAGTCKTSVTATIACSGDTIAFPKFAKECSGDEQCAIAKHQINCCGTKAAIGIQAAASEDFLAAEQVCEAQYPKCKCAVGPTQAEDGKTEQDGAIQVHCAASQCATFVP